MQMFCVQQDDIQHVHCKDSCIQGLLLVVFAVDVDRCTQLI